jgi:phosphoglycolate phosphatase
MKYKAAIFDLDGTLLDTIEDIKETMNKVLEAKGYQNFTLHQYKYFVGKGVDNLIKQVIAAGNIDPNEFDSIKRGYYDIYKTQSKVHTKAYDGINELLKKLNDNDISINVLSNKPHVQTLDVIEHYFGKDVFDYVYGKKEEFMPKPNPDSLHDLIKNLGLNIDQVIYIGDTEIDILTAKNANVFSVGVLWGFRTEDELINAGANAIISKPEDLLKLM